MSRLRYRFALFSLMALVFVCSTLLTRQLATASTEERTIKVYNPLRGVKPAFNRQGCPGMAAVDTHLVARFSFDYGNEGWTSVDLTPQDTLFHVADLTELSGGRSGNLVPIEGSQSWWCGAASAVGWLSPNSEGYGNDWDQWVESEWFHGQSVELNFKIFWDSETACDLTRLQYDSLGIWADLKSYSSSGGPQEESFRFLTEVDSTRIRFRFTSDEYRSDEDGLLDTDGAVLLDDVEVRHGWRMSLLTHTGIPGSASTDAISIDGDHAYVGKFSDGPLAVFDISDPSSPTQVGSCGISDWVMDIALEGDYAYVADAAEGLEVVNIADPTNPVTAGGCTTGEYGSWSVAVSGDYAYLTTAPEYLSVVDINIPSNPVLLTQLHLPGNDMDPPLDIAISGDYAFVAHPPVGLRVIDISNPALPTLVADYSTPGAPYTVTISGDYAYVSDTDVGLHIIDISNPTSPSGSASYATPNSCLGTSISGDFAYVVHTYGIHMVDITDPTNPLLVASYDSRQIHPATDNSNIAISGENAYLTGNFFELQVVKIRTSTNPTVVGGYDTPGNSVGVTVSGDYAYCADKTGGLQVVDIGDPEAPVLAGSGSAANACDAAIAGDYAYVANNTAGLEVFDISDPTNPISEATLATSGLYRSVTVSGNYAYLADEQSGLDVINITDPTTPVLAGSYTSVSPYGCYDVAVAGDYAYVTTLGGSDLEVLDISVPAAPVLAGSYNTGDVTRRLVVSGNYAYIANQNTGLTVIDITDPTTPTHAGNYDTPGGAFGVVVDGNHAYVADRTAGLLVIDITDPTTPTFVHGYDTYDALDVDIAGIYAFVADDDQGLKVIQHALPWATYETEFEDFEEEAPGATTTDDGFWKAGAVPGFGDFAGLFSGYDVIQLDPGLYNSTNFWGFFSGSTDYYSCGLPTQPAVPLEDENGGYIANEIWSPLVDWTDGGTVSATASSAVLEWLLYQDLALDNLVFYHYRIRCYDGATYGEWKVLNTSFYGDGVSWITFRQEIGHLIDPGTTHIQIALGCVDFRGAWGGVLGSGLCHSHAPMIDDVKVYRYGTVGPVWSVHEIDLFQDNFAGDGTTTGTVRMDMARDIMPRGNPSVLPGDSAVVTVSEPNVGLGTDNGKAAVYIWVKSTGGQTGEPLSDDPSRWNYVGETGGWTQIQMDTVYVRREPSGVEVAVPGKFCVDLNDELFTPPNRIDYYFSATDANGATTYWSQTTGAVANKDLILCADYQMEVQCLPGHGWQNGHEILYVDDFDDRGAQEFFDQALAQIGILDDVDRYDVRGPSSLASNSLSSRVADFYQQLVGCYRVIIWNTGNLSAGLLSNGSDWDKTDDWQLLFSFLDQHPDQPCLYLNGDDVAETWVNGTCLGMINLRNSYMGFDLAGGDHTTLDASSPILEGCGSIFMDGIEPDSLVVYGGLPFMNDFDVLTPSGTSVAEMRSASGRVYSISQATTNNGGSTARVLLSGFSFHYIRDYTTYRLTRAEHLHDILNWFQVFNPEPVGASPVASFANSLSQNYPNPFNPSTTIEYSIRDAGPVTLKVYNVAGQLVRTLVDEVQKPKTSGFSVTWDGTSDSGGSVASGVYFYKLVSKDFAKTKKMVVLK